MRGGASPSGEAVIFGPADAVVLRIQMAAKAATSSKLFKLMLLEALENIVQKLQNDLKVYTNRGTPHQRLAQGPSQ